MKKEEKRLKRAKANLEKIKKLEYLAFVRLWDIVEESVSTLKEIEPNKRKAWIGHIVAEIYNRQNGECALCGCPLEDRNYHVDHIIPFCYGGGNEKSNLQIVHPHCNQHRGNQVDPEDLLKYLEDRAMNL